MPAKTYGAVFKLKKTQENVCSLLNESPSYCNYLVLPLLFKVIYFLIALETDKRQLFFFLNNFKHLVQNRCKKNVKYCGEYLQNNHQMYALHFDLLPDRHFAFVLSSFRNKYRRQSYFGDSQVFFNQHRKTAVPSAAPQQQLYQTVPSELQPFAFYLRDNKLRIVRFFAVKNCICHQKLEWNSLLCEKVTVHD